MSKIDIYVEELGKMADNTAAFYVEGPGLWISTNREEKSAVLTIRLPNGASAHARMVSIEQLDELIREALAVRADLIKLGTQGIMPLPINRGEEP